MMMHIIAHVRLGIAGALLRWQLRCGNLTLRERVGSEGRFHSAAGPNSRGGVFTPHDPSSSGAG